MRIFQIMESSKSTLKKTCNGGLGSMTPQMSFILHLGAVIIGIIGAVILSSFLLTSADWDLLIGALWGLGKALSLTLAR